MKTDKVLSFYNLQNEKELEAALDGLEGVEYEKINSEGLDEEEAITYRLSIGDSAVVMQLLNVFFNLVKKNDNSRIRIGELNMADDSAEAVFEL